MPLFALRFVAALLAACLWISAGQAAEYEYLENLPPFLERLTPEVAEAVYPDAEEVLPAEGEGPPAAEVRVGGEVVGYIFSTIEVLDARGFSNTAYDTIAGVRLDGTITGAVNLFHHEPFIANDERRQGQLIEYLGDFAGMSSDMGATDGPAPRIIAGASVSARLMRAAVRDGARTVLRAYLGLPVVTEPTLDVGQFEPRTPEELLADGSVVSVTYSNADIAAAIEAAGVSPDLVPEMALRGEPADPYITFFVGLATPTSIGRNGAGEGAHLKIFSEQPPGTQGILLSSDGRYDFQGFRYQNRSAGYRLDRVRILQGDQTFEFVRDLYTRGDTILGRTSGIGMLPPDSGFDPLAPWAAQLLVHLENAAGDVVETVAMPPVNYVLPARYIQMPEPEPIPAWMEAWVDSSFNIGALLVALTVLTVLLATQSLWTRRRLLHKVIRNGFLLFTLVWLGWMAGGQLSIIHLINYLQIPFQPMELGLYLAEPLIVIIALYTAVSLVLLGRGVFCGWLCPFGAMQELLANVARFFKLPQWNPSDRVQRKLWWGKYVSLAVVVSLAFLAPTAGATAAEIEPFKTAITSMFTRALPYVIYAVALLGIGLFTERFYCRFLCPLGGALAVLDRLHLLNLLKRRPECGSPCHLCERSCPVKAIAPSGKIVMSECFQCLDCQVEYYDDKRCPPLAQQRKLRERAKKAATRPLLPIAAREARA